MGWGQLDEDVHLPQGHFAVCLNGRKCGEECDASCNGCIEFGFDFQVPHAAQSAMIKYEVTIVENEKIIFNKLMDVENERGEWKRVAGAQIFGRTASSSDEIVLILKIIKLSNKY